MTLLALAGRRNRFPLPDSATVAPWNSSTTPNVIPTYDGSGATIHPSVVDMGERWNGYRWWMANTPFPNSNDQLENPEIFGSNNRSVWRAPSGLTNPIDPDPGVPWFHSDTELTYDPDSGLLYCYYRIATQSTDPPTIYLRAQSSPNGVTWTNHGTILELPGTGARLSPAVFRVAAGQWRMWTWGSSAASVMWAADNPLGPWTSVTTCTLGGSIWRGWHGDVIVHDGLYYTIYTDTNVSGNAWLSTSTNGSTWSARVQVMDGGAGGGWDSAIYRPTIIPSTEDGFFDCWYSAYSETEPGGCATGYVRLPISLWPTP